MIMGVSSAMALMAMQTEGQHAHAYACAYAAFCE